jgi:hypothetical protein
MLPLPSAVWLSTVRDARHVFEAGQVVAMTSDGLAYYFEKISGNLQDRLLGLLIVFRI